MKLDWQRHYRKEIAMLGVVGADVLLGIGGAIPTLSNVMPIREVTIRNADWEYINASKALYQDFPTEIPVEWVSNTIMDCDFTNLNAGNMDFVSDKIIKLNVQRKRTDYGTGEWQTLFEIPIEDQGELTFTVRDFTNVNGATYVYRLVPIVLKDGIEMESIGSESTSVKSNFYGVFIADKDSFVRLNEGVRYDGIQTNQITGVHQTLGNRYPIIVANSKVGYQTGGLTGTIVNDGYGMLDPETKLYTQYDDNGAVERRNEINEFLINKKPKLIKDEAGNMWLVVITDAINYSFMDWSQSLADVSISWTEIGNPMSDSDLKRTGILGGATIG